MSTITVQAADEVAVEVLLAAYNGGKFISAQLDSILSQTYQNITVKLRDDGSTDNTREIISEYAARFPEKVIPVTGGSPTGSAKANFMELLKHADSEYIAFSDQDDIWEPDKISCCVSRIKELEAQYGVKTPLLVFTDLTVVDSNGGLLAPSFMRMSGLDGQRTALNYLFVQNIVTGCTMIINRALRELALSLKSTDNILMHDSWLALIAAGCGHIDYIARPTIRYRQHTGNSVGANSISSPKYLLKRLLRGDGIKHELDGAFRQAQELLECCREQLTPEGIRLTEAFCSLRSFSKLKRLRLVCRYHFYKTGVLRRIAEYIWI